jgi:hypothetical protein
MENWNVEALAEILPQREKIGKMENWNIELAWRQTGVAKSRPEISGSGLECWNLGNCRLANANCHLLLPFATFKAAIPSNIPFLNRRYYGSGLASFRLVAERSRSHCPLPYTTTSYN